MFGDEVYFALPAPMSLMRGRMKSVAIDSQLTVEFCKNDKMQM